VKKLKAKDAKAEADGVVKVSKVLASEIPAMAKLVVQLTKNPNPDPPKKRKRASSVIFTDFLWLLPVNYLVCYCRT